MQIYREQGLPRTVNQGFYHPGLASVSAAIQAIPKARVLDLGAPSAASFQYFKAQNCHIRFENLNEFLTAAIADKLTWDSAAFMHALDRYLLLLNGDDQFDVILAWDIFCYLDPASIDYLSRRLARHASAGAKLHMVRYWGNVYPCSPCDYYMVDDCYVVNTFENSEKRHLQKLPAIKTLQTLMADFSLSEFHVNEANMHSAIMDAVFVCQRDSSRLKVCGSHAPIKADVAATSIDYAGYKRSAIAGNKSHARAHGLQSSTIGKDELYGYHKSPALEGVLSLRLHKNARVLDLGSYNKANESTYRHYTPHIHFADLPAVMAARSSRYSTLLGAASALEGLLLSQQWKFDVILGWDVLARYSSETIADIMAFIKPHVHANTYMHLLQYVGDDRGHILSRCNLLTEDDVELIKGADGELHPRHSIFELICAMGYGSIEQSYLFAKGMHENYHEYVVALNGG